MKPHFLTAVILVCRPIHISHLNNTVMLCDCIGERLALEVALRYWSSALATKYPCALFIRKNDSLGELGHR